ncbi:MAG: bifunctional tetrahydrofolate synthase/dihydrofolate synthase, partial [Gammaproteobacteria bacterium]|nr:bifunctional tetrahydrofolate synthase/dihydrofolate synthase [Gammaproteobacteria bacterium]
MSSKNFQSQSLNDWLFYLEQQHPKEIELGLTRVKRVAEQSNLLKLSQGQTVLVAGTNGKGTTIAFMEQYLLSLGFKVGVYSSPHMFTYHERVRINGKHLTDEAHIEAFQFIEQQRTHTELTYFEFGTLAGFKLLQEADLDFVLIEVGLGGRLDATNIIEHDLAIVTSIGLDHVDWLGSDLNTIAFEKAGIFRPGKPAVVGEPQKYSAFQQQANEHNVSQFMQVNDFYRYQVDAETWDYNSENVNFEQLCVPLIPVQNVATAITALNCLDVE